MHTSYFDPLFAVILVVLGMLGIPMPMAVPPLPDEPALTRIVAKDAIAFVAWNGSARPDPRSANLTERLAAEPEVRAMIAQLKAAAVGAVAGEGQALAQQALAAILAAAERPGCMFARRFQRHPRPDLEAAIVVRMGDAAPLAQELFASFAGLFGGRVGGRARHEDLVVDGVTFTALGTDTDHPFLGWAEIDGWIALVAGTETPAHIVAALRRNDPGIEANADYARLMPACQVARPSTKAFLDLARLRDACGGLGIAPEALDRVNAALGLTGATAIVAQSGLEGTGFCQRLRLAAPAGDGLLGALTGAPLGQDGLSHIPLDAQFAVSTRVDALKLESALLRCQAALLGRGDEMLQVYEREVVAEFPKHLGGVRLREDLLEHLGDQFTAWNSPGQGGLAFTGATAIWPLRDARAFGEGLAKVMEAVQAIAPGKAEVRAGGNRVRRNGEYLETFRHGDRTVWWVDVLDDDFPFAPSWTVAGDHVVGSMLPQSLRATLDAMPPNPDQSLVRLPALNKRGAATGLLCWNAKDVVALAYPLLLPTLQAMGSEWQREGFDFDLADLPRPGSLVPHLGRELLLWEPVEKGYALTRTGTLPAFDPLTVGLLVGLVAVGNL